MLKQGGDLEKWKEGGHGGLLVCSSMSEQASSSLPHWIADKEALMVNLSSKHREPASSSSGWSDPEQFWHPFYFDFTVGAWHSLQKHLHVGNRYLTNSSWLCFLVILRTVFSFVYLILIFYYSFQQNSLFIAFSIVFSYHFHLYLKPCVFCHVSFGPLMPNHWQESATSRTVISHFSFTQKIAEDLWKKILHQKLCGVIYNL